jgi:hypothetical protein
MAGPHNRNKAVDTIGPYFKKGGTSKGPNFFSSGLARSVTAGKFGVKQKGVFNW